MKKDRSAFALALGAFFCFTISVLSQQLDFVTTNLGVGNGPGTVVAVDINNDGLPGLVTANFGFRYSNGGFGTGGGSGTTLSVLTNDGAGNLSLGATLSVGNEPANIAVGDVNGDGFADLICANVGDNSLTVLTNNRQGSFVFSRSLAVGRAPVVVVAADLDGDGSIDLVAANYSDDTLSVWLNDGHGNFSAGAALPIGLQPVSLAAADFNGDGKVDLVCANGGNGTLTVLTNKGHGVFSRSATINISGGVSTVIATDVNHDGSIDLVTANGVSIETFVNDGRGHFTLKYSTSASGTGLVAAADMNGDGRVDLVGVINGNNFQGSGIVLTNDGRGKFTVNTAVPIGTTDWQGIGGNYPNGVVPADFNGDGNNDFAAACYGTALVTTLTQDKVLPRPGVTITSPANDAVISSANNISLNSTVLSSSNLQIVIYYLDTNVLTATTNGSSAISYPARLIQPGTHSLQAAAFDTSGRVGWSPEIQINITGSQLPPPPTVSVVTPTNGAVYLTTQGFVVGTKAGGSAVSVELLVDGVEYASSSVAPYGFTIDAEQLSAGRHTLQAVAFDGQNQSGSSAVVSITVNLPGIAVIDFDSVNTSGGAVGGTPLAGYLGGFGVSAVNVTPGTTLEAVNTNSLTGSVAVLAASAPNIFTQAGSGGPESFTLKFGAVLQSFGFTRAGLSLASGLVTHPAWTATAFDTGGNPLSSVSEGLIVSGSAVAAKAFVLTGNGIASVRFDSDNRQTAAFSGVLLDNLVLNRNAVASELSVALSVTPASGLESPARVTLQGTVNDQVSASYYVSFYAGPQLLGVAVAPPYQINVTGLLPGQYDLQARVTDSTGLTAQSSVVPVTVQPGPNSTLVSFDALNASRGPVEGQQLNGYLAAYGATLTGVSAGTAVAVENQQNIGGGEAVLAASAPNVLTQLGSNGPVQFGLRFSPLLSQFGFTRPELLANPFVSHPAWQVTALDGAGVVVGQVEEGEIDSSTNVAAREFSLSTTGGPGIATVVVSSQGSGLTTFNAMLLDNLVLTTNKTAFAPAVAITQPVTGQTLPAPPALEVSANAYDAAGITRVNFFTGPNLIGSATTAPYTILWTNPAVKQVAYMLKAVASNALGLSWTSAVVRVTIASPFQITSQPISQTIAAGGSATFSVAVAGTNGVGYQWSFNGHPIAGATGSTLILPPPLTDANAGSYTVTATVNGATAPSQPAVLTVVDPPVFTTQPLGKTVTAGGAVALRPMAASGSGTVTWQWYLNGTPIAGATSRVYLISVAQPIQSGNYQVVATSQGASTNSAVAAVIVQTTSVITGNDNFANRAAINPLEGPVSSSNVLATVEAGEPLPGGIAGGKSIWFTWHAGFTGTISLTTAGSDFDTLLGVYVGTQLKTLKAVAADDDSGGYHSSEVTFNVVAGTDYQIQVEGYEGAAGRVVLGTAPGTGYRSLSPASGASAPVITHGPVGRTVAPNAGATFTVTASSPTKASYQWYFAGSPIPGATKSALTISHVQPGAVGLYEVVVANAAGAARSEPADLEIGLTQGQPVTSTENKLKETGNAASPKLLAQVLHPVAVGGDTRGFSVAQTFSTEGATSEPGQPEPCGQVGGASQWFVYTAPASGTMRIDTQGSAFNTLVGVYTGSGESFASLEEAGCGYTTNYLTEGQPTVALPEVVKGTQYFILVDGYQGDSGLARLRIGLGQTLSFHSLPPSQMSVTAGGNATLTVTAIGSTPFSYQWQLNGVNVPGATKASYTLTKAQDKMEGNYTVVASNMMGAVTSAPPTALRVQYAPAIISGPSNLTVRLGQPARLSVTALGVNVKSNPFISQWYYSNAPLTHAAALTYTLPATRATNQGPYYIVISNSYGTVTSSIVTLTVTGAIQPPPTPNQPNSVEPSTAEKIAAASGTYSGLFYPATGATQASSGYLTATIGNKGGGAYSAHLLLDGGSYPFSGRFDATGQTQTIVNRPGKTPITALLQLDLTPADGQMTGQIKGEARGEAWQSDLQAGRAALNPNMETSGITGTNTYALIVPGGMVKGATNAPIGTLTVTALPNATTLITTTLSADTSNSVSATETRTAPILTTTKGVAIPLYAPLYTGKGLFLGWLPLTPPNAPVPSAYWLPPNSPNPTPILIQK